MSVFFLLFKTESWKKIPGVTGLKLKGSCLSQQFTWLRESSTTYLNALFCIYASIRHWDNQKNLCGKGDVTCSNSMSNRVNTLCQGTSRFLGHISFKKYLCKNVMLADSTWAYWLAYDTIIFSELWHCSLGDWSNYTKTAIDYWQRGNYTLSWSV